MRKGIAVIVLAMVATSALGWFGGNNDNWNGWSNADGYGYNDARGRGQARGRSDMDGSFSMTINASGRAHTDLETDIDGDWHTDYYGDSGWNSYSYPVRYGYYGTPSNYNPTAGYEAHRKAVEKRKVALKKEREDRLIVK
ncbi:MAG: hypothetical protein HON68_11075 [Gammaproteobacteria bacterium]|jgi:hypothetical protein|nr:hypothetical protein [Gammaproteobacteria bacterium]MBT3488528.1 hypothetical protein [Gammaproteobacteria bacterium]MBT3717343.1 hypothetical protein [Gammaproteobacteria bacterium]MBT3845155.1 hypothetical protein [Gammaproteobacteria bacterium]MBT3893421.1 hypothetical protein [Gammaproteobacteria bacterium]